MKNRSILIVWPVLLAVLLVSPNPATAQSYWDPSNSGGTGSGGTGSWDNSTLDWFNGTSDVAWPSGNTANFEGMAGTVTVNAAVTADGLTFSTLGYTIAGSSTLTLGGATPAITVPAGSNTTITGIIGGTAGVTVNGGILVFSGNHNTYSGSTTINSGATLSTGGEGSVSGGAANLGIVPSSTTPNNIILAGGTFSANNIITLNGNRGIQLTASSTLDVTTQQPNETLTIPGVISQSDGNFGITKTSGGVLAFSGNHNTYYGPTIINAGTLSIGGEGASAGSAANLGTVPSSVIANNITLGGGTLSANNNVSLNANRGIQLTASSTLDVTTQQGSGQTMTIPGIITGNYSIIKTSAGILALSGFNTFTGSVTVSNGELIISGGKNSYAGPTIINTGGTVSTGGEGTSPGAMANLGTIPSSFVSSNILLNGGTFSANNSFTLNPNRGVLLTANSDLDVTTVQGASQTLIVAGVISQSGGSFGITKTSGGNLRLGAINTYSGNTMISGGVLTLLTPGTINNSPLISIAAKTTFDLSAKTSPYAWNSGTTLSASGAGTTTNLGGAVINGPSGDGTINMGSQPISLTFTPTNPNGDSTHQSLYVAQGTLSLSGSNTVTVINNFTGTPLGAGTYILIQGNGSAGTVSGTPNTTPTVTGAGLASGASALLSVGSGNLIMTVSGGEPVPQFSGLTSQIITYGATSVNLTGTISGPGPTYPAIGETVSATINGHSVSGSVINGSGVFSIIYNDASLPTDSVSGSPYAISYQYVGDGSLNAVANSSTTLSVTQRTVTLTGSEPYSGAPIAPYTVLTVANKVGSDNVVVSGGPAVTLGGSTVSATPWPITAGITSLTLGGSTAGNYTLTSATGFVTITNSFAQFSIISQTLDSTKTNLDVCFGPTEPGVIYNVLTNTSVEAGGSWVDVGGAASPVTASGSSTCVVIPGATNAQAFVLIKQNSN